MYVYVYVYIYFKTAKTKYCTGLLVIHLLWLPQQRSLTEWNCTSYTVPHGILQNAPHLGCGEDARRNSRGLGQRRLRAGSRGPLQCLKKPEESPVTRHLHRSGEREQLHMSIPQKKALQTRKCNICPMSLATRRQTGENCMGTCPACEPQAWKLWRL